MRTHPSLTTSSSPTYPNPPQRPRDVRRLQPVPVRRRPGPHQQPPARHLRRLPAGLLRPGGRQQQPVRAGRRVPGARGLPVQARQPVPAGLLRQHHHHGARTRRRRQDQDRGHRHMPGAQPGLPQRRAVRRVLRPRPLHLRGHVGRHAAGSLPRHQPVLRAAVPVRRGLRRRGLLADRGPAGREAGGAPGAVRGAGGPGAAHSPLSPSPLSLTETPPS